MTYNPKYFALSEFNCQETAENEMQDEFLKKLDHLREACGFPFVITSGYRSTNHSNERNKQMVVGRILKALQRTLGHCQEQKDTPSSNTHSPLGLQEWEWLSLSFMLIFALQFL